MSFEMLTANKQTRNGQQPYLDEASIDHIWCNLEQRVAREDVQRVAAQVAARYENARITLYLPIFIRRETQEILSRYHAGR